jgi:hypothetical protein
MTLLLGEPPWAIAKIAAAVSRRRLRDHHAVNEKTT